MQSFILVAILLLMGQSAFANAPQGAQLSVALGKITEVKKATGDFAGQVAVGEICSIEIMTGAPFANDKLHVMAVVNHPIYSEKTTYNIGFNLIANLQSSRGRYELSYDSGSSREGCEPQLTRQSRLIAWYEMCIFNPERHWTTSSLIMVGSHFPLLEWQSFKFKLEERGKGALDVKCEFDPRLNSNHLREI